jgi:hypothetical protein
MIKDKYNSLKNLFLLKINTQYETNSKHPDTAFYIKCL